MILHAKTRIPINAGVYIISSDEDYVFRTPVGPIGLYHAFAKDIMTSSKSSAAEWAQRLNALKRSLDVKMDPDMLVRAKAKARAQQTPAQRPAPAVKPELFLSLPSQSNLDVLQKWSAQFEVLEAQLESRLAKLELGEGTVL